MRGIIRVGDATSHGGQVLAGSSTMIFAGKGVARVGDPISCPKHGQNTIAEGQNGFLDRGVAVAFAGHHGACGCVLISSLDQAGIQ